MIELLAIFPISFQGNNDAAKDFVVKVASTFFRENVSNIRSIEPDNLYR